MDTVRIWARDALALLLPRGCAGCDAPDEIICPDCLSRMDHAIRRPISGFTQGVAACAFYEGLVRRAILAWKDHGDAECDRLLGLALGSLAVRCMADRANHKAELLIVPAPSSSHSMRRRGRNHMMPLARAVARALSDEGVAARAIPVLRSRRMRGKSVQTFGRAQRAARVGGHITVIDTQGVRGHDVVLVDDIITTGATMRQCAAVLAGAGARTVMGLALACTRDHAAQAGAADDSSRAPRPTPPDRSQTVA